jgi:hypothetical protein
MDCSTEFVDGLISALGLKSVTIRPRTPVIEEETSYLGVTAIRGRSVYSAKNRHLIKRALEKSPHPETLVDLGNQLEVVAEETPCQEADEILTAVRDASMDAPDRGLKEFAAGH